MNKLQKVLRCLVVSDIHEDVASLKQIPLRKEGKYDFCFALGDFLSLEPDEIEKEEFIKNGETSIKEMLSILEELSNEVIFIAGNHDPSSFFTNKSIKLTEHSHYLHKQYYRLDTDLYAVGVGGSVMAVLDKTNQKEWEGYPYNQQDYKESDAAFCQDVTETFGLIEADEQVKNKKLVFLTHNGPKNEVTTKSTHNQYQVQSGSEGLYKIIEEQKNIILNAHGHTHSGLGEFKVGNTAITNPGSVKDKNYSIILLSKMTREEWCVSISHKTIE